MGLQIYGMIKADKELSEMTLEELWELFPIYLVAPCDKWKQQYEEIEHELGTLLESFSVERISHIGSTSIKGIWAKDIVDVLIEISAGEDMAEAAKALTQNGFIEMGRNESRISLNKGYTKKGFSEKVYHVHLRFAGDNDELYFRDYLNAHPDAAKEYEAIKMELWKKYEHNRDAYTEGKSEFIKRWTAEGRRKFGGRY